MEKSSANWLLCEFSNNFFHRQAFNIQSISNQFLVYVLSGVKAYNQTITLFLPLLHLSNEVFPELGSRTCLVSFLGNEISAVLLVICTTVQVLL